MPDKLKYTPPQIFEVPLRHEQAVLAACNTSYTGVPAGTSTLQCVTSCKHSNSGGNMSSTPAS